MSKSCSGMLEEYIACVEESKCVKVEGKSLSECCKADSDSVPECKQRRELYFNCKRGMVDMRTRIRGNKGY